MHYIKNEDLPVTEELEIRPCALTSFGNPDEKALVG